MRQMKESKIEWIGEIPNNWQVSKLKRYFYTITGNGFSDDLQGLSEGDYPFCKASDISVANGELYCAQNYITNEIAEKYRFNIVPNESIIFAKIGEAMKKNNRAICHVDCCIDNNCMALVPTNINRRFAYYFLKCVNMQWFDNAGTVPCISNSKLLNSGIVVPNISEQQAIADFLDGKCGEIDSMVKNTQTQIETLKAYKQSVITEAVTKGIRPNRPTKPSGIDWIGDIPEDWSLQRIKYICTLNDEVLSETTSPDAEIKYVDISSVSLSSGINHIETYCFGDAPSRARRVTQIGDVIISTVRTYLKAIAVIDKPMIIVSTGFCVLRAKTVNNKFLSYYVKSNIFTDKVSTDSVGISYPAITSEKLKEYFVPYPTVSEQQEIADYLDEKCAAIDKLIAAKQAKIEKLNEYKKSLIYEYVTGKREIEQCGISG